MIVLGDKGVGKTMLCNAMMDAPRSHNISYAPNDQMYCPIETEEYGTVDLHLWDTVGEQYSEVTNNIFRGANGIVLMFDVTVRESFQNIQTRWMPRIRSLLGEGGTNDNLLDATNDNLFKIVLVANKIDLTSMRLITDAEGRAMAASLRVPYIQLSTLHSENHVLQLPFVLLTKLLMPLFIQDLPSSARASLLLRLSPPTTARQNQQQNDTQQTTFVSSCCG